MEDINKRAFPSSVKSLFAFTYTGVPGGGMVTQNPMLAAQPVINEFQISCANLVSDFKCDLINAKIRQNTPKSKFPLRAFFFLVVVKLTQKLNQFDAGYATISSR